MSLMFPITHDILGIRELSPAGTSIGKYSVINVFEELYYSKDVGHLRTTLN